MRFTPVTRVEECGVVMTFQLPSVGRIVHYVSHRTPVGPDGAQQFTSECRAAIVTDVIECDQHDETSNCSVGLAVLNPTGLVFNTVTPRDEEEHAAGTWHWPERV